MRKAGRGSNARSPAGAAQNPIRKRRRLFKDKTPRRRLAFLNALLLALQRLGGGGKLDDYAREVEVWIGGRRIPCTLLTRFRKPKRGAERQEVLDFQVRARGWYASRLRFEDDGTGPVEESLRQICCGLVVVAELESRDQRWQAYRYRLELFEDELKRAAQNRREQQEAAYRRLVEQARAHREAEEIRLFVAAARRTRGTESLEFARWQWWGLQHADSIDPLVAGVDLALPEAVIRT